MKRSIAVGLAAVLALGVTAARAAPPPAALMPERIGGPGWNVLDLEAQKAWYMDKLGMRLVQTLSRDGKVFEYLMGYEAPPKGAILALLLSPQRPPGPNRVSRLILDVPDAKALAAHLGAQGVPVREVVPNIAYFVTDPEGNPIELYTAPKD